MRAFAGILCLILVVASGTSCRPRDEEGGSAGRGAGGTPPVRGQEITGTVRYIDVEGGFYGIETEEGARLDPVNLPDDLKEDGARVKARVERLEDRVSIHMWGTLVRILEIERL